MENFIFRKRKSVHKETSAEENLQEKNGKNELEKSLDKGDILFTHTGYINRKGQKCVFVNFERRGTNPVEYAEGSLPDCKIERNRGFAREEILLLENYLLQNKSSIWERAKEMSDLRKIL